MHPVTRVLLLTGLWWLPPHVWAVCELILQSEWARTSADAIARAAGFSSRYQMNRELRRFGLPASGDLAVWLRCIEWIVRCEEEGRSLCALHLRSGRDPASAYRAVRRVTGLGWTAIRELGGVGLVVRFMSEPSLVRAARFERVRRARETSAGRTMRRSGGWAVAAG